LAHKTPLRFSRLLLIINASLLPAGPLPLDPPISTNTMEERHGSAGGDVQDAEGRGRIRQILLRDPRSHVPIAKKVPGLRKYEVSQGPVATPAGPSGLHLIATLHFDDLAAIQRVFASAEGQAAAADVQTFATGGVDMLLFDSREI
jgi:uncharacterized protein (TIGR02118 family)